MLGPSLGITMCTSTADVMLSPELAKEPEKIPA